MGRSCGVFWDTKILHQWSAGYKAILSKVTLSDFSDKITLKKHTFFSAVDVVRTPFVIKLQLLLSVTESLLKVFTKVSNVALFICLGRRTHLVCALFVKHYSSNSGTCILHDPMDEALHHIIEVPLQVVRIN